MYTGLEMEVNHRQYILRPVISGPDLLSQGVYWVGPGITSQAVYIHYWVGPGITQQAMNHITGNVVYWVGPGITQQAMFCTG